MGHRSFWKGAALTGVLIGLYSFLGFWGIPLVIRWGLEQALAERLERPIQMQAVRFNPYSLVLEVEGLQIAERGGGEWLQAGQIWLDLEWSALRHQALWIRELRLADWRLRLHRKADGSSNIEDLIQSQATPGAEPAPLFPFGLYNLQLTGGTLEIQDELTRKIHRIEAIELALPFLSSLPEHQESFVTPHLSMQVNGSPLKLQGQSKPFAVSHETHLDLELPEIDLLEYLPYLPLPPALEIHSGKLGAKARLIYRLAPQANPQLSLEGQLILKAFEARQAGQPLLKLTQLEATLAPSDILASQLNLASLHWQTPEVSVRRDAQGRLEVLQLLPQPALTSAQATPASPPWAIEIQNFEIQEGSLRWQDATLAGGFATTLSGITGTLQNWTLAGTEKTTFSLAFQLGSTAQFQTHGQFSLAPEVHAEGEITLKALPIEAYAPYFAKDLPLRVKSAFLDQVESRYQLRQVASGWQMDLAQGSLNLADLQAEIAGTNAWKFSAAQLRVKVPQLSLSLAPEQPLQTLVQGMQAELEHLGIQNGKESKSLVKLPLIRLDGGSLDLKQQKVTIQSISSRNGQLFLERLKSGLWAWESGESPLPNPVSSQKVSRASSQGSKTKTGVKSSTSSMPPSAWKVTLDELRLQEYSLEFRDAQPGTPVQMKLRPIDLEVQKLTWPSAQPLQLQLNLVAEKSGSLHLSGKLALEPLQGTLKLVLKEWALAAWEGYWADRLYLRVKDGVLNGQGVLTLLASAGGAPQVRFDGGLALQRFASLAGETAEEFIRWQDLSFHQIQVRWPEAKLAIQKVGLKGFYLPVLLLPDKSLNLQHLLKPVPKSEMAPTSEKTKVFEWAIEQIHFTQGQVYFSDRSIQPKYTADLQEMNGALGPLESSGKRLSRLELETQVDRYAPLQVTGELNLFASELSADLKLRFKNMEMSRFSPYASRYLGYTIQQGKLSLNLRYQLANRDLKGRNTILLDQFNLGESTPSPEALKLPVKLAIALLKDRQGQIELDLPVSGKTDDPQFKIGGVLLDFFRNLLEKAVTSPFSLMAGILGDGEELRYLEFEAGRSDLSEKSKQRLERIARLLKERPEVQVSLSGYLDLEADGVILWRESRRKLLQRQKFEAGRFAALEQVEISEADYQAELKRLARQILREATTPETPPETPEALESWLREKLPLPPEELQGFALQRAREVQNYLVQTGGIPAKRLFLQEAMSLTPETLPKLKASRVNLSLKD